MDQSEIIARELKKAAGYLRDKANMPETANLIECGAAEILRLRELTLPEDPADGPGIIGWERKTTPSYHSLTQKQQAVLDYICEHIIELGYPPTVREIGAEFGIGSPNGVKSHLKSLERKGAIEVDSGLSRGIRVLRGPSLDCSTIQIMGRFYALKEESNAGHVTEAE